MKEQEAISKMVAPSDVRPVSRPHGGIMQIWVTRVCDKCCFGCTQGSNLKRKPEFISLEQFEQACISLKDYFGLVAMFGGNPCLHPQFEKLCDIMAKHIDQDHRGLWSNKLFGHGPKCRKIFRGDRCNLNVHLDRKAYDEIKRDWPEAHPFGLDRDSRHGPPWTAIQDLIQDEEERWELISSCDINKNWSAMICVVRGRLRGFFCEIAGAQAIAHQDEPDYPDLGVQIKPGWWKLPIEFFGDQIRFHCHACGVPLRGYGNLSQQQDGIEQVTKTHVDIYKVKDRYRPVQLVTSIEQTKPQSLVTSTDYIGNSEC